VTKLNLKLPSSQSTHHPLHDTTQNINAKAEVEGTWLGVDCIDDALRAVIARNHGQGAAKAFDEAIGRQRLHYGEVYASVGPFQEKAVPVRVVLVPGCGRRQVLGVGGDGGVTEEQLLRAMDRCLVALAETEREHLRVGFDEEGRVVSLDANGEAEGRLDVIASVGDGRSLYCGSHFEGALVGVTSKAAYPPVETTAGTIDVVVGDVHSVGAVVPVSLGFGQQTVTKDGQPRLHIAEAFPDVARLLDAGTAGATVNVICNARTAQSLNIVQGTTGAWTLTTVSALDDLAPALGLVNRNIVPPPPLVHAGGPKPLPLSSLSGDRLCRVLPTVRVIVELNVRVPCSPVDRAQVLMLMASD
jgi:hypothetical protein